MGAYWLPFLLQARILQFELAFGFISTKPTGFQSSVFCHLLMKFLFYRFLYNFQHLSSTLAVSLFLYPCWFEPFFFFFHLVTALDLQEGAGEDVCVCGIHYLIGSPLS